MSLTFQSFVLAGAVPPYSAFLLDVLRYYGIRLAHLTPNSLVILSVFAYLCEQFLGVPPSLDLFRSYYICRGNSNPRTIGSCHFRPRRKQNTPKFIYVQTHVPQQWKDRWVYIEDHAGHEETSVPSEPAVSTDTWQTLPRHTPHLAALHERVAELRQHGLTGAMVLADAIKRRLSPLRNRARLAYLYVGEDDDTRTFPQGKHAASPLFSCQFVSTASHRQLRTTGYLLLRQDRYTHTSPGVRIDMALGIVNCNSGCIWFMSISLSFFWHIQRL
jgi:hypothetical protein